jgi:hypothetical protein
MYATPSTLSNAALKGFEFRPCVPYLVQCPESLCPLVSLKGWPGDCGFQQNGAENNEPFEGKMKKRTVELGTVRSGSEVKQRDSKQQEGLGFEIWHTQTTDFYYRAFRLHRIA